VVRMPLEDIVELIPIRLLQHLQEPQLSLPVRPRVIVRPPFSCVRGRFGTGVARDGEDSRGGSPACFWRGEEGSRATEGGRMMRVVGEPCVVSRLRRYCRRVDLGNDRQHAFLEKGIERSSQL
jgi:hypothetical protein